jgi:diguanylate cyclase (GGDEF)-like protein/PAS domain S-box-containing protein
MLGGRRCRVWMGYLLCLIGTPAAALAVLDRQYLFEPLAGDLQLAQNTVNALLQDSNGFLWIGTQGGLHRFDGRQLLLYQHRPDDPASLPDSFISALAEDDAGGLWVGGSSSLLARIDLASGEVATDSVLFDAIQPPVREVTALAWQPGTGLWIGDRHGVLLLPQDAARAIRIADFSDSAAPESRRVFALAATADGSALAATVNGLYRIDPSGAIGTVPGSEGLRVSSVMIDSRGDIVAGGAFGLARLSAQGFRRIDLGPELATHGAIQVVAIDEDADGRIWVGLFGHGLVRIDPDGTRLHLRHDRHAPGSLPEDNTSTLLVDRGNVLWVGGFAHGVTRSPAVGTPFRYLAARSAPGQPLVGNNVRAITGDARGNLWIGLEGDGLRRLDLEHRRFENHSRALRDALGLPPAEGLRVQALDLAPDGLLWAGTTLGLVALDLSTGSARTFPVLGDDAPDAGPADVRSLLRGEDGSLWVGTFSRGLLRLWPEDRRRARFQHDAGDPASLSHDMVLAMLQAPSGALWVGTYDGLNRLDPGSGEVLRIRHDPEDPGSISGNLVRSLHSDHLGRLWVGTHSGLNRLDSIEGARASFTRFLPPGQDLDHTIYGILEDDAGLLWLSTNRGLLHFNPENGAFRRFGVRDGIQGPEFNGGAHFRRSDGHLVFGGTNGLTIFDPASVGAEGYEAPLRITSLKVGTERRELIRGLAPDQVTIGHDERVLSIAFTALDFASAEHIRYAWRLDGFDSDWNEAGTRREATYTNLAPGSYRLEVRATDRDGVWRPDPASIAIHVRPPWWSSLPMRAAYALLLLLGLLLLWRQVKRRRLLREQYADQLREREDRLKLALWGSGDEFWDWDVANNRFYRLGADQLLGFVETEQQMSSDDWRKQAVHSDDRERVERILADHLAGRSDFFESEHRIRGASGDWVWVRSRGKVVERDAEGRPLRICGTARNITDSRRAERERRIAAEVIRSMSEGVSVVDLSYRFVSVNPAFTRITGYDAEEVLGEDASMLNGPQHSAEEYLQIRQQMEQSGHWHGELWQRRKDGEDILCWLESSEVRDAQDIRTHYVAVLTDITDRKRAEQELRYLANYDTLTGLPNRTLLGERLAHAVIRARRQATKISVLFLDLDRFKHVNDSMGHAMGDRLLKAAGARLRLTVRDTDTVARLGGDEFTVVLEDIHTVTQAERVAQKILEAFAEPLELDGRQDVVISPSIGIAMYPDHGQVPTDLLKFADTAMYQAKDRGRNTYQVYAETMDAEARLRATMVGALRRALDRGEFRLVYQPKLSLLDDTFTGVEALLRWDSEELGPIPPTTFIPLAEETGLIIAIGEWVLREACMQLLRWDEIDLGHLTVAVNVSVLQLFRGELAQRLGEMVAELGIAPERIELELTESMVMANAEQSINTLRTLKSIGVNLAIDDFGTGYSSLAYLKRLPIDTLKIDKEFVGDITTDPDDEAITATIIAMAHSLGLNVVAEGVETEEQLLYLREQRCDEVQGFWLSAPLEAERCTAFLLSRQKAQQKRRRAART